MALPSLSHTRKSGLIQQTSVYLWVPINRKAGSTPT